MIAIIAAAQAAETALPATDPAQLMETLANALKLAQTIGSPIIGALFVCLIVICMAILWIASYYRSENIRREQAWQESLRVGKEQMAMLERIQSDASQSLRDNMDLAYKQDFEYFTKQLAAKNYTAIWGKIPPKLVEKVGQIVYNEALTPEDRAGRIILVLKQAL